VPENASVLASFVACLELAFSLPFSKRRQGLTGLAPTKALKTVPASVASAAARHAGWPASAQDALERGAQAARAAMEQASQADPSVGAVVMPGEAADATAAPSPPDVSSVPASTPAVVIADSPAEPSIAPDVGMVGASPLAVVPDLPVPGPEEGADAVAEVGDRKPATLAKGKPSTLMAMVPDVLTTGEPDALAEERATPRPVLGGDVLIPAQRKPNEWCGQAFRFWSRGASKPLLVLNDEQEEQSRDELREYAEAAMGSLRSTMEILSRDVPRVL
jgi:hypothetical protein